MPSIKGNSFSFEPINLIMFLNVDYNSFNQVLHEVITIPKIVGLFGAKRANFGAPHFQLKNAFAVNPSTLV
jgi:hypothetical protein